MSQKIWNYLTTTGDWNNIEDHIKEIKKRKRNFVWYHFVKEAEKNKIETKLRKEGLFLIECMPCFFVLACHPKTPKKDIQKMTEMIHPKKEKIQNIIWKGKQFGYSHIQISAYIKEINKEE